jgi:hypothetical protein
MHLMHFQLVLQYTEIKIHREIDIIIMTLVMFILVDHGPLTIWHLPFGIQNLNFNLYSDFEF